MQGGIKRKIRKFLAIMEKEGAKVGVIQETWAKRSDEGRLKRALRQKLGFFNHGPEGETERGKGTMTIIDNE